MHAALEPFERREFTALLCLASNALRPSVPGGRSWLDGCHDRQVGVPLGRAPYPQVAQNLRLPISF
jgi:hypothetical protein